MNQQTPEHQSPQKKQSYFLTLQAVAATLAAACLLVFVAYLFCWLNFDEDRPSFGISNRDAARIGAIYGPILAITFTGLRDSLNTMLGSIRGQKSVEFLYFDKVAGAILQYVFVFLGLFAVLAALFIVSSHRSPIAPEAMLGIAAGIWALTAGEVFRRYLRAFVADRPRES